MSHPMFTEAAMTNRLLRIFDSAGPEALEAADWYGTVAARDVRSISDRWSVPFDVTAAVLAVTSPGPKYATNVSDTNRLCRWHAAGRPGERPVCSTYGPNVHKADAILALSDLDPTFDPATLVTGPKVSAFYRNICGDWDRVTLDRHAVRPISKLGKDTPASKVERARMESAYRRAAAKRGLEPAMFQAVVWVALRGAAE